MDRNSHTRDIEVAGREGRFFCRGGESVLDALRPIHHRTIVAGCRNGGCGVCKIKVLSGVFIVGDMSAAHISADDRSNGVTLACRTYPMTALSIDVVGKLPEKIVKRYGFLRAS